MSINIQQARADTPGCEHVLHFNNAGAGLMPRPVLEAQLAHLQLEAQIGGYEAAHQAHEQIENSYQAAARLINARPEEIAVVENATVAWQMAYGAIPFQRGDLILTGQASYVSDFLNFLLTAERTGATIEVVPNDAQGQINIYALQEMMDERVKLIALTHIPTNGGLVNPAEAVGQIARQWNCWYLLDACQSVGQYPVDVQKIGCDLLSTTGRKFLRGPRGVGFLYVRQERITELTPPFIDLHSAEWVGSHTYKIREDARRFENWENNYAAKIGLGVAIDYALQWGIDPIWQRLSALAAQLRQQLAQIPGVEVHDLGETKGGIVTFTLKNREAAEIQQKLGAQKMNTSVSAPNSTLLDAQARGLRPMVRASVHYYNTEEEIGRFCEAVQKLSQ